MRRHSFSLTVAGVWMIAVGTVLTAVYLVRNTPHSSMRSAAAVVSEEALPALTPSLAVPASFPTASPAAVDVSNLPDNGLVVQIAPSGVYRRASLHTIIPNRPRQDILDYTVAAGDSVFEIAKKFNLKPETILWANYDQLQDSPDMLSPGMALKIPPTDGVYYQWQSNDTIQSVADQFEAKIADIINWPGNKLDLADPKVEVGQGIMVPGGHREFRSWVVPQIARGKAGVSKSVYGPGACEGGYEGVYGAGFFVWPSVNAHLSGNDFWSGHLGIDIAAGEGDPVYASDSGVIVFSGWATGGYGYMIMIDHGNGYQTLYAHLSYVSVHCGQSVYQGEYIGGAGSTGNSTGTHLHFEIRLWGQFVNPWQVLP